MELKSKFKKLMHSISSIENKANFSFVFIGCFFTFLLPLYMFPSPGLDPSWVYTSSEALLQGLQFGKDIIFTSGPYSFFYTQFYHANLAYLFIFAKIYTFLCFFITIFNLCRGTSAVFTLCGMFFLFFASTILIPDALYYSYCLLTTCCIYKTLSESSAIQKKLVYTQALPFGILLFFPLLKLSFLPLCLLTIFVCLYMLWIHGYKLAIGIYTLSGIVSLAIWEISASQDMASVVSYLTTNLYYIIQGYGGAMSLKGPNLEVILYLLAAFPYSLIILFSKNVSIRNKIVLFLSVSAYLFISFKAGFVRHDAHALIAVGPLLILPIFLYKATPLPSLKFVGPLSIMIGFYIYLCYGPFPPHLHLSFRLESLQKTIFDQQNLKNIFENNKSNIRKESPIKKLSGTCDIYSFNQSSLIASGNELSLRPTFQSYSVYNQHLARINESHLRSAKAPENIIFRMQTIDYRYPALADGFSYPTLRKLYATSDFEESTATLYLKRNTQNPTTPDMTSLANGTFSLDQFILLPDHTGPLFVRIQLKPNLMGKMRSFLFKPPQTKIKVVTLNTSYEYRFIPSMAESGFILSPHMQNTSDFKSFMESTHGEKIIGFKIITSKNGALYWNDPVNIEVYELEPKYLEPSFDEHKDVVLRENIDSTVICHHSFDDIIPLHPLNGETNLYLVRGWINTGSDKTTSKLVLGTTVPEIVGKTKGNVHWMNLRRDTMEEIQNPVYAFTAVFRSDSSSDTPNIVVYSFDDDEYKNPWCKIVIPVDRQKSTRGGM